MDSSTNEHIIMRISKRNERNINKNEGERLLGDGYQIGQRQIEILIAMVNTGTVPEAGRR